MNYGVTVNIKLNVSHNYFVIINMLNNLSSNKGFLFCILRYVYAVSRSLYKRRVSVLAAYALETKA